MANQKQINIKIDKELFEKAKAKCKSKWGIGLSPVIKIFLKSFVTQKGVGFYVGDDDLRRLVERWLRKKSLEIGRKGCGPMPGPRLKDIYEL